MPIYEYACLNCGSEFEMLRRISDETLPSCPSCKGEKVKKRVSQTAFQLKGGGWYKDGYASSSKADAAKPSGSQSSSESASSGAAENSGSSSKADAASTSTKKDAVGS